MIKLRFLLTLLFSSVCFAQYTPTPNIGLQIPSNGSANWNLPLNYNFNRLDLLLSGNATIPGLNVGGNIVVTGSITAGSFVGASGSTFVTGSTATRYSPAFYNGVGSSTIIGGITPVAGIIKWSTSGPPTVITSADIVALWTGTCTGTNVLQGNGVCGTGGSSGGLTSFQGRSTAAATLQLSDVDGLGTISNSTTGNAATATALAATPAPCGTGLVVQAIAANGTLTCISNGSSTVTLSGDVTGSSSSNTVTSVHATSGTINGVSIGGTAPGSGAFNSLIVTTGSDSLIFSGTGLVVSTPSGDMSLEGGLVVDNNTVATPSINQDSNYIMTSGRYYNGTTSTSDTWSFQDVIGSGSSPTSTLMFTHSGSPGAISIAFPGPITSAGSILCTQFVGGCGHSDVWSISPSSFTTSTVLGGVFYEPYATNYGDLIVRQSGSISCSTAPTIAIMDLGTSITTNYASASVWVSFSTSTSDGVYNPTGLGTIPVTTAGHFYGLAFSSGCSGTPPTFDVTLQLS